MNDDVPVNIRRIPKALWHKVRMAALSQHVTVSEFVARALEQYLNGKKAR